ncbi:MAG: DUF6273 domain-containing protein [Bacilli bacterium]
MTEKKKRNIIIGSLFSIVLLMVVGYAAFSTALNIKGTSNITSNWNVKITNVTTKNIVGTASNNGNPTFTDTSATFKTNLESPGDSLEYEVTITNAGNLNAKVDKITLSDTNNSAIKFTSSGLTEGDIINAGSTSTLLVKAEFLSTISSTPDNKTSNLTVTVDYVQAESGSTPSGPSMTTDDLKTLAVTEGDGLYIDTYEEGRYVYKGANPNNYITFNNEEWRIMAVEADGTLKLRKNESIGALAWDTSNSNNWARPSTLNTYLNNDYYNMLSGDAQNQIQSHAYGIGSATYNNTDLAGQIASENSTIWTGNIGLMSASDYLKANTNTEKCGNYGLNNTNMSICKTTNYLISTGYYWTISPYTGSLTNVSRVRSDGDLSSGSANYSDFPIWPVLYLKSDITLSGEGTQANPYIVG